MKVLLKKALADTSFFAYKFAINELHEILKPLQNSSAITKISITLSLGEHSDKSLKNPLL